MSVSRIADIAVSGMLAQRLRMTVTASNIANAQTTRTAEGGPYRRRDPVFAADPVGGAFASGFDRELSGVAVPRVEIDSRPGSMRLDPGHPDADENGFVQLPNVDLVEELTNMQQASRSFEANLLALRKAREMSEAALRIGK
jgi:flagellar basal-body rod protein FlgC